MRLFTPGRGRFIVLTAIVFAANFLADRVTKLVAVALLAGRPPISLLGGTVVIGYAENSGAFLGMGALWPPVLKYALLLALPIALCLYGLWHCAFREPDRLRLTLYATIAGGGLGNLVDRLFNGFRVVDFLNFGIGGLRTGVLNVADLSVTFGALALLIHEYALSRKGRA